MKLPGLQKTSILYKRNCKAHFSNSLCEYDWLGAGRRQSGIRAA